MWTTPPPCKITQFWRTLDLGKAFLHLFLVSFFVFLVATVGDNEIRGVQLVAIYNHKTARAKFSIFFVNDGGDICATRVRLCVCVSNDSLTVGKQIMRSVVTL